MNVTVTFGSEPPKGPCTVCGKPSAEHGSYPTCASHPYTSDGTCQYVLGATCVGAECVNGCVGGRGIARQLDPNKMQLCRVDPPEYTNGQPCNCPEGTCRLWKGGLRSPDAGGVNKTSDAAQRGGNSDG
jgi:hypothetical protein